jgi:hypothetical protein
MRAKIGEGPRYEASRRYYLKHRQEILAKRQKDRATGATAKIQRSARQRLQDHINKVKSVSCLDCGWDGRECTAAMDFDHVRGEKVASIAQMVRNGGSLEALKEEISKCEIVCTRCHRIRTVKRGQHGSQV